jgi:hypothetical protein
MRMTASFAFKFALHHRCGAHPEPALEVKLLPRRTPYLARALKYPGSELQGSMDDWRASAGPDSANELPQCLWFRNRGVVLYKGRPNAANFRVNRRVLGRFNQAVFYRIPENAIASLTHLGERCLLRLSIARPMDDRDILGCGDVGDRSASKPRIDILDKSPLDLVEIIHGPMRLLFADPYLCD